MMMYCTVHALGELAVLFPVAGSFSAYSTRFIDPAWGFAMGWVRTITRFPGQVPDIDGKIELCTAVVVYSSTRNYLSLDHH